MATIINKRMLINKSNSTIVATAAVAAFIVVFCIVASRALVSQELYQSRVISKKNAVLNQIKTDITVAHQLKSSYENFISENPNIIGGNNSGDTGVNGNNAKIVLDALPSSYDFPALATSLAAMITSQGLEVNSITGTDESATLPTKPSSSPASTPIPFSIGVNGSYQQVQSLVSEFENSIRPFHILSVTLTAGKNSLSATINAETYFQPGKTLNFSEVTVK